MATNKLNLSSDNLDAWLASTGFLFPSNEIELLRFDKLYEDINISVSTDEVSIDRILAGTPKPKPRITKWTIEIIKNEVIPYRMVARNGSELPDHILKKIELNQNNTGKNSND